ncbi:DUF2158 domain-containing protein [Tateyamaria sp. ANG-S1]|uniref:YodC family protein n=1 Tax=Tateyamaria sp. ANG-S1 TaxID=1577905 RepID=UPI000582ADD1|nr:DUF2158 domain-containing protein [Tateyamaria sp. ANG-S1]KIC48487.1 hypothetical protein RA29_12130 [Tateyamaria sp. ANG-S1]
MNAALQAGDVVRLRSGGPAMVVESLLGDGAATCVWMTYNLQRYNAVFALHTLVLSEADTERFEREGTDQ